MSKWRNKYTGELAEAVLLPHDRTFGLVFDVVIPDDLFGPQHKLADGTFWREHWEPVTEEPQR